MLTGGLWFLPAADCTPRLRGRRGYCGPAPAPLAQVADRDPEVRGVAPGQQGHKTWRAALATATLPPGHLFHDLRRSAIRNMVRGAVDPTIAIRISGHATSSTSRRYNIVSTEDLRDAVRKTAEYVSALPTERKVVEVPGKRKGA